MDNTIERLLDVHPDLDELFDILDITPERVIEILVDGGHVELPDYIKLNAYEDFPKEE